MIGYVTGNRSGDIEGIERRYARPGLGNFQTGIRKIEPPSRSAHGELEEQPLMLAAIVQKAQVGSEFLSLLIQQKRVFAKLLGKHPLRQTGNGADRLQVGLHTVSTPRRVALLSICRSIDRDYIRVLGNWMAWTTRSHPVTSAQETAIGNREYQLVLFTRVPQMGWLLFCTLNCLPLSWT